MWDTMKVTFTGGTQSTNGELSVRSEKRSRKSFGVGGPGKFLLSMKVKLFNLIFRFGAIGTWSWI
jgi:hypothetical protein